MPFIHEDFLLAGPASRRLYHSFAAPEPILDYHNHLPPKEIAEDRQFENLYEIWLAGDHYKWRAMRANGEAEALVTGGAEPFEKFMAFARAVPKALRNPLYHWTHLELKRYFGIDELLGPDTATQIWDQTKEMLASPEFRVRQLLRRFQVRALCTTDDPIDDLAWHVRCREEGFEVGVFPTFRPDKALAVDRPELWNQWCDRLSAVAEMAVDSHAALLEALDRRHEFFHQVGGRLSDHGLRHCHAQWVPEEELEEIFQRARKGEAATPQEMDAYASSVMLHVGRLDAKRGWTMQLHLGPLRDNNRRLAREVGADAGCDSIGDYLQGVPLSLFLDRLDQEGMLPKTVLYNVNPSDNYVFATMAGNYSDGKTPGKVQFGSGWWFVDQKEGMEWQINALSNTGLLSRFIGMLTDSRSLMSFPRHEYFRRTLCNLVGADVDAGLLPNDDALVGGMIRDICYANARDFLQLPVHT